jgi:hypothetical protein
MNPNAVDNNEADDEEILLQEGKSFVYPDGDYPGNLSAVKKDVSESSGNRMLVFDFYIPQLKATVRRYVSLADNAVWALTPVAEALGVGKAGDSVTIKKLRACIGAPVILTLVTGEYKGKKRSEVEKIVANPNGERMAFNEDLPF